MINLVLGISLTLNVVTFLAVIIYFKVKAFGIKKIQNDIANKFFASNDDVDDMLDRL